jgi:hypothetical protein
MDDNTTATRPAVPTRGPIRGRRALGAAALLLSVTAAISACGSSGGKHTSASGSASVSASASASASASDSASASASASAGSASAPGAAPSGSAAAPGGSSGTPGGTGALPSGKPSAPLKSPAPGGQYPVDPIHPSAALKPESYLTSGNQLTVFFTGGVCDKYALKLNERSDSVGVDVVISQPAPSGQECPALSKRQSVVGTLSQPLNGRPVVSLRDNSPVPKESMAQGGPVSAGN